MHERGGPAPFAVELAAHDPDWAVAASIEAAALRAVLGPVLLAVHHVGSTAVPGLAAKPILDLLPVVADLAALDGRRAAVEGLGYVWWGENGLPGRRYATRDDPATGRRRVQLHGYAAGSSEIVRHLAFRDHLRRHPDIAAAYGREKARCLALHGADSHACGACKGAWIDAVEASALSGSP